MLSLIQLNFVLTWYCCNYFTNLQSKIWIKFVLKEKKTKEYYTIELIPQNLSMKVSYLHKHKNVPV